MSSFVMESPANKQHLIQLRQQLHRIEAILINAECVLSEIVAHFNIPSDNALVHLKHLQDMRASALNAYHADYIAQLTEQEYGEDEID